MKASTESSRRQKAADPVMEHPVSASLLALVSGLLNAWTFAQIGTFATVQSGNLVTIGYFSAEGDWQRVVAAATTVLAFGLGAASCAVVIALITRRGGQYSPWILGFETLGLGVCVLLSAQHFPPTFAALAVSFIAGVQGNAFHRDHGMLYGNTAMTFVVQMAFSFLGRSFVRRQPGDTDPHLRISAMYAVVFLAFALGGAAGFAFGEAWSSGPLLAAALVVGALAVLTVVVRGPVDPENK
jgi:uncharacterized membrane protein YoaK (UPF0700 family)